MAGLVDKIKKTANISKIKKSELQCFDVQSIYDVNLKYVLTAIYSTCDALNFIANMSPEEAARYYVDNYEENKHLYVLTFDTGGMRVLRHVKDATEPVIKSLETYRMTKSESGDKNAYYNAAAEILSVINDAIKKCVLVGFTCDKATADKFLTFEFSPDTSVDDLNAAWESCRISNAKNVKTLKKSILNKVLGSKRNIAANVSEFIIGMDQPFKTIQWKIITHQLQYDEPVDEKAFSEVLQYSSISSTLKRIGDLTGLNFGKTIQVETIQVASGLGEEYVDELYTENGWLGEVEMEKKYKEFKEIAEQRRREYAASPEGQREAQLYQERLERAFQADAQMLQERERQKQIETQQENMAIRVQIAELRAHIDLLNVNKSNCGAGEYVRLCQQIESLERQCKDLERKLR